MDLVSFIQTIRRHIGVAIVGVILTLVLTAGLVSRVQPTYITSGSIELVAPSVQVDPITGKVVYQNPSQLNTQPTESYALVLSSILTGPETQAAMTSKGFNNYKVTIAPVGTVLDVSTQAPTAQKAKAAYTELGKEIVEINKANQKERTPQLPDYAYFTTNTILEPQTKPSTSGKTRVAGGIFALGVVATVGVVFLVDWLDRRRGAELAQQPATQKSITRRPPATAGPEPVERPKPVIPERWPKRKPKDDEESGEGPGLAATQ